MVQLSNQELEVLTLELETQIINMNISKDFNRFKLAPSHICKGLNLRIRNFLDNLPVESIDICNSFNISKTESVKVYVLLLQKDLYLVRKNDLDY